jgi:hypothetical protein
MKQLIALKPEKHFFSKFVSQGNMATLEKTV